MADPWAIVVVPAEGDPGGLLAEGPCGARPPAANRTATRGWRAGGRPGRWWTTGLVIWWNSALAPEGWDRLVRVACPEQVYGVYSLRRPNASQVAAGGAGLGRVVLLDLVDGRLVERQPSGPEPQQR